MDYLSLPSVGFVNRLVCLGSSPGRWVLVRNRISNFQFLLTCSLKFTQQTSKWGSLMILIAVLVWGRKCVSFKGWSENSKWTLLRNYFRQMPSVEGFGPTPQHWRLLTFVSSAHWALSVSQAALSLKTPFPQECICQVQWIPAPWVGRLLTSKGSHRNQNGLSLPVFALEFTKARPKEHDDNLKAHD